MKKVFAILLMSAVCFGAFAQSNILEDWEERIEQKEDDVLSPFSFMNVTYNHNFGAQDGYTPHGWGLEISSLYLGFQPWRNGRITVGLFDMKFDFGFLRSGNHFVGINGQVLVDPFVGDANKSRFCNFSYQFPIGYIQRLGRSKWSAAAFICPGFGWDSYTNESVVDNIRQKEHIRIDRNATYFRLDAQAMLWYDNFGLVVRYTFPRGFQGKGLLAAGISVKL